MKFKLIALSMSVLGLISFPVLAENTTKQKKEKTTHKKHHVHHVHQVPKHKKSHISTEKEEVETQTAQPIAIPVMEVGRMNYYQPIMDSMTQNLGRAVLPRPDWFQRIGITGGINVDGHWGNRRMGYMGENSRRISLNDAYLNVSAFVNDWTKAFASLSFNNTTGLNTNRGEVINSVKHGVYSNAYTNNKLDLEQGYITIGNFDCSPFFVQLGKQFQDFGRYSIHPIERSLTQVLSESLQTSAKVGFLTRMGLNGSIYAFDDTLRKEGVGHTKTVYGAALGFDHPCDRFGYDFGVGYMSSMTGVNDVAEAIKTFELLTRHSDHFGTFEGTVGAWSAYGDLNTGPFGFSARYTTAAHEFASTTLSTYHDFVFADGARPWAADLTAGYGFNALNRNQNIYVGYQTSNNAVNLLIPKQRWILGYGIEVLEYTTLSAEYGHDQDYSSGHGGTGRSTNTVGARAAVKFS